MKNFCGSGWFAALIFLPGTAAPNSPEESTTTTRKIFHILLIFGAVLSGSCTLNNRFAYRKIVTPFP